MAKNIWNHGANTEKQIKNTFDDNTDYNAIEVDIRTIDNVLTLAHKLNSNVIDTTLESFLKRCKTLNSSYTIKFDFKDKVSIIPGFGMINTTDYNIHNHTIIANVDALVGPGGTKNVIISPDEFIFLTKQSLPKADISLGMTTGWDYSTLFFRHGYTPKHIDNFFNLKNNTNLTLSLRMTILSQTDSSILSKISKHKLLLWGESGILEHDWIYRNSNLIMDQDLDGVGTWLIGTYIWWGVIITLFMLFCTCILRRLGCKKSSSYNKANTESDEESNESSNESLYEENKI